MFTFLPRFSCLSLALAASLFSIESLAQQSGDNEGQVDASTQELIQQGIGLRRSGKDEAALAVFLDAERQAPNSVRVLLHVTAAAQATGRWLMAHQYLQKAAAYRNDPYYQRYRAAIKSMEDTVGQHVGQLRVLGTPAGAEVLLNGESVGTLPMNAPKFVEVGSYVLEVRKPGFYTLRRPLSVPAAGLAQEAVELKEQERSKTLLPEPHPGTGASPSTAAAGERPKTGLEARWITWTLAGTGVALGAASGAAFFVREQEADHWNDDSRCLQGTRTREEVCGDVRDRAETAETVGLVTGIAAAGFVGLSLAHWIWSSGPERHESGVGVGVGGLRARCDAGFGGVACHGSF